MVDLRGTIILQGVLMASCVLLAMLLKPLPMSPKAKMLQKELEETECKLKEVLSQVEIDDDDKVSVIRPKTPKT